MIRRDYRYRDQSGDGAIKTSLIIFGMSRLKSCHFQTFATENLERDFRDRGGYGATLPLMKRRDRCDQLRFFQFPDLREEIVITTPALFG